MQANLSLRTAQTVGKILAAETRRRKHSSYRKTEDLRAGPTTFPRELRRLRRTHEHKSGVRARTTGGCLGIRRDSISRNVFGRYRRKDCKRTAREGRRSRNSGRFATMAAPSFSRPARTEKRGIIPLTSNSALAARTARDSRPEINNNFSAVRHATVFEGVKAGTTTGESIQKIISAPMLFEGKVVGVIQISRKGGSLVSAGPDFTPEQLGRVLAICKPLGKLVSRLAGE